MYVDTHCHLDFHQFDEDRDEIVARAQEAGVEVIVNPATDLESSRRVIALAERYPGVYAMVGVHPNECAGFQPEVVHELRTLAAHPKVVAIGEIGLDYHWQRASRDQQHRALEAQLDLAAELDLPVSVHCRDAHADLRDALRKWVPGAQKRRGQDAILGVLHAYSGDWEMAQEVFAQGMVLSLGGPMTFRNARQLQALVPQLPLSHLMLETDAPYLAPHPYRGRRNEPAYVPLIAQALAELQHISVEVVAAQTTTLAQSVFTRL